MKVTGSTKRERLDFSRCQYISARACKSHPKRHGIASTIIFFGRHSTYTFALLPQDGKAAKKTLFNTVVEFRSESPKVLDSLMEIDN